ncbi:dsDNA nuclease domain-containing protein [Bacillus sp. S/N-304-OC-R1]|uniref:dsDNA nuclease domain-containing protein n=1 Tax=Bacillus sp. S/N-304-OC-R1 TaxID=2758034 RepID=UPI001C8EC616|nr:dsDNA nuclease domain-containing protein [Bacillus sp. S/N-304-OC-R1]MBY0120926.1 DUF4297 domain-containing protein [Bacillus sp. S/N-304-OC-R1]
MDISAYPSLSRYKARENTGSLSSNRLAMQISFAMWKLFELFQKEDFLVVMDYIDDIAIFSFSSKKPNIVTYQLKTKDSSTGNFELKTLVRNNVFLKLYDHIEKLDDDIREIYLVTNNPLKYKSKTITGKHIAFKDLEKDFKELIEENMSTSESFNAKGLSSKFIYSLIDMSIHNHKDISQSKLNELLIREDINISVKSANALFSTLLDILTTKQNYEFSLQDDIVTVLKRKSYSKSDFKLILDNVRKINADVLSYEDICSYYKGNITLSLRDESLYRRAIASVKEKCNKSPNILQNLNESICRFIEEQIDTNTDLNRNDLVNLLQHTFNEKVGLEFSKEEKEVLYMQNIETVLRGY